MRMILGRATLILAALLAGAGGAGADSAAAQEAEGFPQGLSEFSLSVGYAHLSLGSSSIFDSESALRIEPSLSLSPIQQVPQLRLGADVGVSMVLDNSTRTIISRNGQVLFAGTGDIPLWLLEPELRLSWRQPLGDQHQFFIEPGIAGGIAWGFLELTAEDGSNETFEQDDSTLFYRAFLRLGAHVPGGIAGIDISWLSGGHLDLGDNAAGDLNEFYIGIFGALLF